MKPFLISVAVNIALAATIVTMYARWPRPTPFAGSAVTGMRRDAPYITNFGAPICPLNRTCMTTDAIVFADGKIAGYHDGYKWYDYDGKEIK